MVYAMNPWWPDIVLFLRQAARDGRIDVVEFHLRKFQKLSPTLRAKRLNKRDENRTTALHYAIRYGHVDIVKLLIKSGACKSATPL